MGGIHVDLRAHVWFAARSSYRPPYAQLLAELEVSSYVAVGRNYGVSDNAVRKWVRWYQQAMESSDREG